MRTINWMWFALYLAVLAYAAWWDLRRRIVPDRVHVLLLLIALGRVLAGELAPASALAGLLATGVPLLILAALVGGLGGGDVKLAGAASACVGLPAGLVGVMLGMAGAALGGGLYVALRKPVTKTIPCAPFLGAGFAAAYLFPGVSLVESMIVRIGGTV